MTYGSCDMKSERETFFVILGHFLHFYPTNNLRNQKFEKMKKGIWRYHQLHKRTKNMIICYNVPEMAHD